MVSLMLKTGLMPIKMLRRMNSKTSSRNFKPSVTLSSRKYIKVWEVKDNKLVAPEVKARKKISMKTFE